MFVCRGCGVVGAGHSGRLCCSNGCQRAHERVQKVDAWLITGTASLASYPDHIDGDSTNNRRENLRLACPNCDSQLATYKNRNKGRGRHARRQRYAEGRSF